MADILDSEQLKRNILSDMRVELTKEFDKNFERKAFFSDKWKRRANPNAKGSKNIESKKKRGICEYIEYRATYNVCELVD